MKKPTVSNTTTNKYLNKSFSSTTYRYDPYPLPPSPKLKKAAVQINFEVTQIPTQNDSIDINRLSYGEKAYFLQQTLTVKKSLLKINVDNLKKQINDIKQNNSNNSNSSTTVSNENAINKAESVLQEYEKAVKEYENACSKLNKSWSIFKKPHTDPVTFAEKKLRDLEKVEQNLLEEVKKISQLPQPLPQNKLSSPKTTGTLFITENTIQDVQNKKYDNLDYLSAKYEVGKKDASTISTGWLNNKEDDPGGKSYGKHQFSSKKGVVKDFLEQSIYKADFANLEIGTELFDKKWVEICKQENFVKEQDHFVIDKYFKPTRKLANTAGITIDSEVVNMILYSCSIQHGVSGTGEIIKDAANRLKETGNIKCEEATIICLYNCREKYIANNKVLSEKVKKELIKTRCQDEKKDALDLFYQKNKQSDLKDSVINTGISTQNIFSQNAAEEISKKQKEQEKYSQNSSVIIGSNNTIFNDENQKFNKNLFDLTLTTPNNINKK